jgi:EAL domain-containing protein (putative c-di-GMP-specific phosphodiesterase class I)
MSVKPAIDNLDVQMIVPYFQPIMDLDENVVWCYESLARLVTRDEQTFLPSEFLSLVEKQQCYGELTRTIFSHSLEYFRHKNAHWSMNIAEQDIVDMDMPQFFTDILSDYPNAARVTFELPANVVFKHPQAFNGFIAIARELGAKVMIDHVGMPSGNIYAMLNLPIDGIKISGALIAQLAANQAVYDFVHSLQQQATEQELTVVAAHIEDAAILEQVKGLGIKYGQGFYFCQPSANVITH